MGQLKKFSRKETYVYTDKSKELVTRRLKGWRRKRIIRIDLLNPRFK